MFILPRGYGSVSILVCLLYVFPFICISVCLYRTDLHVLVGFGTPSVVCFVVGYFLTLDRFLG